MQREGGDTQTVRLDCLHERHTSSVTCKETHLPQCSAAALWYEDKTSRMTPVNARVNGERMNICR